MKKWKNWQILVISCNMQRIVEVSHRDYVIDNGVDSLSRHSVFDVHQWYSENDFLSQSATAASAVLPEGLELLPLTVTTTTATFTAHGVSLKQLYSLPECIELLFGVVSAIDFAL